MNVVIVKFILLGSLCYIYPNLVEECRQVYKEPLINATECRLTANRIGKTMKTKIEASGGSMTHYEANCLAIDKQGLDIDQTFKISYNIL